MSRRPFATKNEWIGIVAIACLIAIVYFAWQEPNTWARSRIKSILLSEATPREKLNQLEPYVRIGESISAVRKRISPRPNQKVNDDRASESSYGLGDVNLCLSTLPGGKIVAIGYYKYRHGLDRYQHGYDPTIWLERDVQWK